MRTKKEKKQIHPPSSESVVLGALVTNIGSDRRPEIHNCKLDSAAAMQIKVTLTGSGRPLSPNCTLSGRGDAGLGLVGSAPNPSSGIQSRDFYLLSLTQT